MERIKIADCEECFRSVYMDEGKVSQWYMSRLGRCRQCMEKQMEIDLKEMEATEKESAGYKQLWAAVQNNRISEVSKILHGDPRFK